MNTKDVENFISEEDIKEIAEASGKGVHTVRKVLNGTIKRSSCKKYIIARIKRNKELVF